MLDIGVAPQPANPTLAFSTEFGKPSPHRVPSRLQHVLPGMVARGHGIDALCLYLDLARTALLDLLIELNLPTPHDRPLRKPVGRKPWTFADTTLFIVLWMAGWHAESLGERFGRSRGSSYYKARHLGLPRRDRKLVFRPPRPGGDLPGAILQGLRPEPAPTERGSGRQGSAVRTTPNDPDAEPTAAWEWEGLATYGSYSCSTIISGLESPVLTPTTCLPFPTPSNADLFGPTPVGMPPVRKPKRQQVAWTRERDQELAHRWWARQHYKNIARDMGISSAAVHSRRARLELPSFNDLQNLAFLRPDDLVEEFDPSVVAMHIAAANYYERKCNQSLSEGKTFWFWTSRRHGSIICKEHERLRKRRESRSAARPGRSRKPTVPLLFVSQLGGDAGAEPVPHPASPPAAFAPHPATMRA